MEIKNKVILELSKGIKKEFTVNIPLSRIKTKYAIGGLFITSTQPFQVGIIKSLTCFSNQTYKN
jgi:hypothetical protein